MAVSINILNAGNMTLGSGSSQNDHSNEFMIKSVPDEMAYFTDGNLAYSDDFPYSPLTKEDIESCTRIVIKDSQNNISYEDFKADTWYPISTIINFSAYYNLRDNSNILCDDNGQRATYVYQGDDCYQITKSGEFYLLGQSS